MRAATTIGGIILALVACTEPDDHQPGEAIEGPADAAVGAWLPEIRYEASPSEFLEDGPRRVSDRFLLVGFTRDATVADANAALDRVGATLAGALPDPSGETGGLAVIEVAPGGLERIRSIATELREDPSIELAAPDRALTPDLAPPPPAAGAGPRTWTWGRTALGGNWGLELIRAPAAWNVVPALKKRAPQPRVPVGIVDQGFQMHRDLRYDWSGTAHDHGTAVASIIAAEWGDEVGIDGATPFASLSLREGISAAAAATHIFADIMGEVDVVVMSMGARWDENDEPATDPEVLEFGAAYYSLFTAWAASHDGELPVVVVSAGNDSTPTKNHEARYNSGPATAGIEFGAANVIVAEALGPDPTVAGGAVRAGFSNIFGTISAPGDAVTVATGSGEYMRSSGTSLAAPLVGALVAYLYAVEPDLPRATLHDNPALEILRASAVPLTDLAANRVDAFGALMELDQRGSDRRVLQMIGDFDDGTIDGNTRVTVDSGIEVLDEDADGDGGPGDGVVDMADFRRFRDWLLEAEGRGAQLDGRPDHPKRDLNGDGIIGAGEAWPRADLNGDGILHRRDTREVPGFSAPVTDLDVLARASDYPVSADGLARLLDGGDLHLHLDTCLARADVDVVDVVLLAQPGGGAVSVRSHRADRPEDRRAVYSVERGTYELRLTLRNGAEDPVGSQTETAEVRTAGEDVLLAPDCGDPPSPAPYLARYAGPIVPHDLNDLGQVLGNDSSGYWVFDPATGLEPLPGGVPFYPNWYLSDDGAVAMPTPSPLEGDAMAVVHAVSRSGLAAGVSVGGMPYRAFLYSAGITSQILVDDDRPYRIADINDAGLVLGEIEIDGFDYPADLNHPTASLLPVPVGFRYSVVDRVNEVGWAIGLVNLDVAGTPQTVPALWRPGEVRTYVDEGIERLEALNDVGTVIATCGTGCFRISDDGETFRELASAQPREDAPDASVLVTELHAINNGGDILVRADGNAWVLVRQPSE